MSQIDELRAQVRDPEAPLTLIVHAQVRPGQADGLIAAFRTAIATTREEPGCLRYELNQDSRAAHEFLHYERWSNWAALAAHLAAPHTRALLDAVGPLLERLEMRIFAPVAEPDTAPRD
jgi:quinol monooxygenase YgiN